VVKKITAGKASGKRTLTEVMDQDTASNEKRKSKFFRSPTLKSRNPTQAADDDDELPVAGPSRSAVKTKKMSIVMGDEEPNLEVESNASIVA
jgi:hypothetical protein